LIELVRLKNVSKSFTGVQALDRVNLHVNAGEVLSLVGENGAGKSTLMKIMSGTYAAGSFQGEIFCDGRLIRFNSPLDAEKAGIAIIHQELSSFGHLTVAENLFVGHWPNKNGLVNWKQLFNQAQKALDLVGAECKPTDRMGDLSVGSQQMVEIAKSLTRECKVLILDEPTSALTPKEIKKLFVVIDDLKKKGHGLIYISHKMEEIYKISDRILVLRDGQTVHSDLAQNLPENELITHMVGRSLDRLFPEPPPRDLDEIVFEVKKLSGFSSSGKKMFGPISLALRKGEIFGFAGLLGAGRSEFLTGVFRNPNVQLEGEIFLHGKKLNLKDQRQAWRQNMAFIGEDRKRDSLFPTRSLDENVSIARLCTGTLLKWLNLKKENLKSLDSLQQLNTRMTSPAQLIQELSGGNQQKVILARALQTQPDIILMDEPTRGVDVGAKYEIYEILFKLAAAGKSILLVSSDLPELISLSDQITVLSQGQQTATFARAQFDQSEIMKRAVATSSQGTTSL
jgi:ABC-type sugar transport system ATPase subunit